MSCVNVFSDVGALWSVEIVALGNGETRHINTMKLQVRLGGLKKPFGKELRCQRDCQIPHMNSAL